MDKLHCMQCFVRVAEAKSFAGAAHVLGVSPSSISKIIAAFESTLGFALFNRSTRHFSLTESGAAYLEECRRIFEHIERAETRGRHQRELPSGIIKVAMHPAFRFSFFSEVERLKENGGRSRRFSSVAYCAYVRIVLRSPRPASPIPSNANVAGSGTAKAEITTDAVPPTQSPQLKQKPKRLLDLDWGSR